MWFGHHQGALDDASSIDNVDSTRFRNRQLRGLASSVALCASVAINVFLLSDLNVFHMVQKPFNGASLTRRLKSKEMTVPNDKGNGLHSSSDDSSDSSEDNERRPRWRPAISETRCNSDADTECSTDDAIVPRMSCTGSTLASRTCYFQDLLWDLEAEKFVFFDKKYSSLPFYTDRQELGDNEPWIYMSREVLNASEPVNWNSDQFYMDWRVGEEPPSPQDVVDSPYPAVHLRTILSLHSIGHFIRDNLAPLTSVPMRFGADPRQFTWVRWPSSSKGQSKWNRTKEPLLNHYRSWLPQADDSHPDESLWPTWSEVVDQAVQKGQTEGKFIRFRKLLAGRGSTALDAQIYEGASVDFRMSRWAHTCEPTAWRRMRDIAAQNVQAPDAGTSAARMNPLVLILDGQPSKEKRMFSNAEAAAENLRKALPNVEVHVTRISELSGPDQLKLLLRTTVLVSNIGSRSFRLLFLPDGAQAILVGAIEDDPAPGEYVSVPFKETDMCWDFLGYVDIWRYHVKNDVELAAAADIIPPGGRKEVKFDTHREKIVFWRDQDIAIQPDKLRKLVETALDNVKDWQDQH